MKCLGSQLIITENKEILRGCTVELSEKNTIPQYFSIIDGNHERAATSFYDGIISPPIISASMLNININTIQNQGYNYIDLTKDILNRPTNNNNVIFDFCTDKPLEINNIIRNKIDFLSGFSVFELIFGCTIYPLLINNNLSNNNHDRFLWEKVDLLQKKITNQTTVTVI